MYEKTLEVSMFPSILKGWGFHKQLLDLNVSNWKVYFMDYKSHGLIWMCLVDKLFHSIIMCVLSPQECYLRPVQSRWHPSSTLDFGGKWYN